MADTSGSGGAAVTGSVAFYKRPEPLAPDRHGKLGVKRIDKPFLFAQGTHLVPITIGEFASAGLDYPIIFGGPDNVPLAVLGMRNGQNLFIGDDGAYEPHRYLPAFIRRYPFVFAEDKANNRFIACIDVEAPMVAENAETPFFNGQEPTQFTRDAVDFLSSFEQQRRETQAFVARLKELNLFDNARVTFTPQRPDGSPGDPVTVAEYVAVSADKLKALPAATLAELRDSGHLPAIYVHIHSLRAWQWLLRRAGERPTPMVN
jgi:hypothetical protein